MRSHRYPISRLSPGLQRLAKRSAKVRIIASLPVLCLVGLLIFSFVNTPLAQAFSTISQSNWSGGVGSSTTNQYSSTTGTDLSTPGEINVDTSPGTAYQWCDTTDCDENWTQRQPVYINNDDGPQYDNYQLQLTVPYQATMKADFSDLRFANDLGDTDLNYFVLTKTDSDSATVYVNVPTVTAGGSTTIYMYYGNSSASSLSAKAGVFDVYDEFDNNNPCGSGHICPDDSGGTFADGGYILNIAGSTKTFNEVDIVGDRSVNRIWQMDVRNDLTNFSCSSYNVDFGNMNASPDFDNRINFSPLGSCDDGGKYWSLLGVTQDGDFTSNPNTDTNLRFRSNQWATFRITALAAGGEIFSVSTDGGVSFTDIGFIPTSSDTGNSNIMYTTGTATRTTGMRNVIGNIQYDSSIVTTFGSEEFFGGRTGTLVTATYDLGDSHTYFGAVDVDYTQTGDGSVKLYAWNSNSADTTRNWYACGPLSPGADLSESTCFDGGRRYVQLAVVISQAPGSTIAVNGLSFQYIADPVAPTTNLSNLTIKKSSTGSTIASNGWVGAAIDPYVSWTAAQDNAGGSGLTGYCIYFGTSPSGDPASSKGLITSNNARPNCAYLQTATNFTLSDIYSGSRVSGTTYYINIKAIDNSRNLTSAVSTQFQYDAEGPEVFTAIQFPSRAGSSKIFTVNWITSLGTSIGDAVSGPVGFKYCITNALLGFEGCSASDDNWYGLQHTSGKIDDTTDFIPFSDGTLSTVAADFSRIDNSVGYINSVFIVAIDNAGNPSTAHTGGVLLKDTPSSEPNNLAVSPTSNSLNAFSFTWDPPDIYLGTASHIDYCWTVNVPIASDLGNCSWTGEGINELANGPYATRQGNNTLYLLAKDETANTDSSIFTSVDFNAETAAPGTPQNLDISDVSIKATSTWKLALSWSEPQTGSDSIASYKVLRSTDNSSFTEIGSTSTSNLSFIDSGLSQTTYYYKVKACDDAGSCGVASSSASYNPTGRYTEPAHLTADTDQPKTRDIGTKKANIYWFTDRDSDSRVAFGTKPGAYSVDEVVNSTQTTDHSINLTNLQAGTKYYYIAKWTDQDGNVGQSTERSFTTAPAPDVSEVKVSNIDLNNASVSFTVTNATKAAIEFGPTENFGGIKSINTSTNSSEYSFNLDGLSDGTKYIFRINTTDSDGNEYHGSLYNFSTPPVPRISNFTFTSINGAPSSTQRVSWTTNVPASSEVTYTPLGGKSADASVSTLTTDHQMTISGLNDDTDYALVARSRDALGNAVSTDPRRFHTSLDTRSPGISDVNTEVSIRGNGSEARAQIVVTWKTDELATSQVAYGQGSADDISNRTAEDPKLSYDHVVIISDIPTSSIYYLRPVSADKAANQGTSDPQTVIIGRPSDNVFDIIYGALQRIFGI